MNSEPLKIRLLELINNKREVMIETANREGYTSEQTVKCSQDLDLLLYEYQQILIEEQKPAPGPFHDLVQRLKLFSYQDTFSY